MLTENTSTTWPQAPEGQVMHEKWQESNLDEEIVVAELNFATTITWLDLEAYRRRTESVK
jgi:hypothetical protein